MSEWDMARAADRVIEENNAHLIDPAHSGEVDGDAILAEQAAWEDAVVQEAV